MAPCKVHYDPTQAKEMLLMAATLEEQQLWVARLLKRIQKSGYKASGQEMGPPTTGTRVSPQESMRSAYRAPSSGGREHQQKAATLPANNSKK